MNKTLPETGPHGPVEKTHSVGRGGGRPTGRVSRRQWLDAALEVLVMEGIEAVRVNSLARKLNISKSGFYWHFQDRAELLEAMKSYWMDEFSQQIISDVLSQTGTVKDRMKSVVRIVREKESGKLDLAFVSWARSDPEVHALIDKVRDMRVAFVSEVLSETGCDAREIQSRARLFVTYFSWSEVMFPKSRDALEGENLDEILSIISGVSPG